MKSECGLDNMSASLHSTRPSPPSLSEHDSDRSGYKSSSLQPVVCHSECMAPIETGLC